MGTRTGALMLTNAARDRCTALWNFSGTRMLGNNYKDSIHGGFFVAKIFM